MQLDGLIHSAASITSGNISRSSASSASRADPSTSALCNSRNRLRFMVSPEPLSCIHCIENALDASSPYTVFYARKQASLRSGIYAETRRFSLLAMAPCRVCRYRKACSLPSLPFNLFKHGDTRRRNHEQPVLVPRVPLQHEPVDRIHPRAAKTHLSISLEPPKKHKAPS